MPKPISITKEMIDQTAFDLVCSQGPEALTARNIANQVGCSTQPIYKIYKNLEELKEQVFEMISEYTDKIIFGYHKTSTAFLNAGLGFIYFAATEKTLFRAFSTENYQKQPVFGPLQDPELFKLMEELLEDSVPDPGARQELFLNTMIYTIGLAHLAYAGQLGMTEKEMAERLIYFFCNLSGIEWKGDIYL